MIHGLFEITDEWLDKNKTKQGGYKKKQVELLGIDWPLTKGWKKSIVGCWITTEAKRAFESHSATGGIPLHMRVIGVCKKLSRKDKKVVYEFLRKELTE